MADKKQKVVLNEKQKAAVEIRGVNTLVSAGAGSGKTFVLTQRVLALLKEGVNIDELFVATFTNAATNEMKERIGKIISKTMEAEEKGSKVYIQLQNQLPLINRANICSIDSFCSSVVKQNFQKVVFKFDDEHIYTLDPSFKIFDRGEKEQMEEEAISDFLENGYSKKDPEFMFLSKSLCVNYSDRPLIDAIQRICNGISNFSNERLWFENVISKYEQASKAKTIYETVFADDFRHSFDGLMEKIIEKIAVFDDVISKIPSQLQQIYDDYTAETSKNISSIAKTKREIKESAIEKYKEIFDMFKEAYYSEDNEKFCSMDMGKLKGLRATYASVGSLSEDKQYQEPYIQRIVDLENGWRNVAYSIVKSYIDVFAKGYSSVVDSDAFSKGNLEKIRKQVPIIEALFKAVKEYKRILLRKKFEKQMFDFNDIARFCHDVLVNEDGSKTQAAEGYSRKFKEIIIDEYQDISYLQDDILQAISNGSNLFMVGDIKQAIYRFREATPDIFNHKYQTYREYKGKIEEGINDYKILLSDNYRSRSKVLEACNYLFETFMSLQVGEVDYTEAVKLIPSAKYSKEDNPLYNTEIHLIYTPSGNKKNNISVVEIDAETGNEVSRSVSREEYFENIQVEDRRNLFEISEAAKTIKDLKATMQVVDEIKSDGTNTYRPMRYSDFCILLRKPKNSDSDGLGARYKKYLTSVGIPVTLKIDNNLFETYEIQIVMNYLKALDNPMQDIELSSILLSTVYSFTNEELLEIRKLGSRTNLYTAMVGYMLKEHIPSKHYLVEKIKRVKDDFKKFRIYASKYTIYELISEIYFETNMHNYISMLPDSEVRLHNLDLFREKALEFDGRQTVGLANFLRFIETASITSVDESSSEDSDAVKIMTIHGSKGLEFPVVILGNIQSEFRENTSSIFLDNDSFSMTYQENFNMQTYNLLPYMNIKSKKFMLEKSENMRLLYVACTRAKEKLVIIGEASSPFEKEGNKFLLDDNQPADNIKFNPYKVSTMKSFSEWICSAMSFCMDDSIEIKNIYIPNMDYIIGNDIVDASMDAEANKLQYVNNIDDIEVNMKIINDLVEKLDWEYPNYYARYIPTNMSVTEVKQMHMQAMLRDDEIVKNTNFFTQLKSDYPNPKFMRKKASDIRGAALGSIYHRIFELIDFHKTNTTQDIEMALDGFVKRGIFTSIEVEAVDEANKGKILGFLNSNLGQRLKSLPAENIFKETQFIMFLSADKVAELNQRDPKEFWGENYKPVKDDILINGIIDLFFKENDKYVLVDYKTDNVENIEELRERYAIQMDFYKYAVEKNYNIKIDEVVLYSIKFNESISL